MPVLLVALERELLPERELEAGLGGASEVARKWTRLLRESFDGVAGGVRARLRCLRFLMPEERTRGAVEGLEAERVRVLRATGS